MTTPNAKTVDPPEGVIRRDHVRTGNGRVVIGPHGAVRVPPVLELVREGDVVKTIKITCGCGETHYVDCDYE